MHSDNSSHDDTRLMVGTFSPCGHAVIGSGGHIFLLKGSNNLHEQYF